MTLYGEGAPRRRTPPLPQSPCRHRCPHPHHDAPSMARVRHAVRERARVSDARTADAVDPSQAGTRPWSQLDSQRLSACCVCARPCAVPCGAPWQSSSCSISTGSPTASSRAARRSSAAIPCSPSARHHPERSVRTRSRRDRRHATTAMLTAAQPPNRARPQARHACTAQARLYRAAQEGVRARCREGREHCRRASRRRPCIARPSLDEHRVRSFWALRVRPFEDLPLSGDRLLDDHPGDGTLEHPAVVGNTAPSPACPRAPNSLRTMRGFYMFSRGAAAADHAIVACRCLEGVTGSTSGRVERTVWRRWVARFAGDVGAAPDASRVWLAVVCAWRAARGERYACSAT